MNAGICRLYVKKKKRKESVNDFTLVYSIKLDEKRMKVCIEFFIKPWMSECDVIVADIYCLARCFCKSYQGLSKLSENNLLKKLLHKSIISTRSIF